MLLKKRINKYPYKAKDKLESTDPIPKWCRKIKKRIEKTTNKTFNQVIVNEYTPGQGISQHIDHTKLFDDIVVTLSTGSDAVMEFANKNTTYEQLLKRRSLAVLTGDSRYRWTHCIPARKQDNGIERTT